MFKIKKDGQIGKYQPEFIDKLLIVIVILILSVFALAWWYKYKYYNAIEENNNQDNYIIQLEKNKKDLLNEIEKYKKSNL